MMGRDAQLMVGKESFHLLDVALDVVLQGFEPTGIVAIGSDGGHQGGDGSLVELAVLQLGCVTLTLVGIGDDAVGRAGNASQVERLGGTGKDHAYAASRRADAVERDVTLAPEGEVGMYLVGDDDDVVTLADVGQAGQGFLTPVDAAGIAGIAEYQHLGLGVDELLQPLEVHAVLAILEYHGVIHSDASEPFDIELEMVIDRRLDDDLVARIGESQVSLVDACDDAWGVVDPFALNLAMMVVLYPLMDGIDEGRRRGGVAKHLAL